MLSTSPSRLVRSLLAAASLLLAAPLAFAATPPKGDAAANGATKPATEKKGDGKPGARSAKVTGKDGRHTATDAPKHGAKADKAPSKKNDAKADKAAAKNDRKGAAKADKSDRKGAAKADKADRKNDRKGAAKADKADRKNDRKGAAKADRKSAAKAGKHGKKGSDDDGSDRDERDAGKGPRSIGAPNKGRLAGGIKLRSSRGLKVRDRAQAYGLPDLVKLLQRAAGKVRKKFPKSVMLVGDLSRKMGGSLVGHNSHQSGRDADVGLYVANSKGKPAAMTRFVAFDGDGKSKQVTWAQFDDARNWALVEALVTDTTAPVHYIFVSNPLRARLLAWAKKKKVDKDVYTKAAFTMLSPSDADVHDDHFHVRIRCPDSMKGMCVEESVASAPAPKPAAAHQAHAKATDTKPSASKSDDDGRSGDAKPEDAKSASPKSASPKSDDAKSAATKNDAPKNDATKSDDAKSASPKSDDAKSASPKNAASKHVDAAAPASP